MQQLLAQLLENGRNSRWLSISLGLGLHARSRLVEYQWSWERWGISLEQHGRTWSMIWRAGTTISTVTISNTLHRHGLKSCNVCKFPLLKPAHVQAQSEVCQRPSGWSRGGMGEGHVVRWDQNITFWYKLLLVVLGGRRMSTIPRTPSQPWSMGVENHALGVLFCKGDRMTAPYWGEDGWGHVSRDFGQKPSSLSKSFEDGSWLGLPARQWAQTHSKGN